MAVYIDGKGIDFGDRPQQRHLFTDGDPQELHELAQEIGLRRSWYQNKGRAERHPHYDVMGARLYMDALKAGAIEVDFRETAKLFGMTKGGEQDVGDGEQ